MDTSHSFLSLWAYRLFLAGLLLLPLGVIFSEAVSPSVVKVALGTVMLGGAFIIALMAALRAGTVSIVRSPLLIAAWLLPLAYLAATLASPSLHLSLVGGQLDTDTVFFMTLLALAVTVPMALFHSRADVTRAFFVLLISAGVVALVHLVRLFVGADALSFGLFTSPLFSLIGKWNDLGIFFGLVAVLSLITLESMPLEKLHQSIVTAALVVALFFVAVVNFTPVWICLGVLALGIVLYRSFLARRNPKVSIAGIVVLLLSLIAVFFSSSAGAYLGNSFGTNQIEARPSFGSTLQITEKVLAVSPIFGSGPNTFLLQWDKYRPQDLNNTVFWNADFTSGVGFIPTGFVTAGLLGLVAWVLFALALAWAGIRGLLLQPPEDAHAYHLMLSTFAAALFVLVMSFIYLPSTVILILGFVMAGMYLALYQREVGSKIVRIQFSERPRVGFLAVLGGVILIVATAAGLYSAGTVMAGSIAYQEASITAQRDGNLDGATASIGRAISVDPQDRYYRLAVLINLAALNKIVTNAGANPSADDQKAFQTKLGAAVENGLAAVKDNQSDYRNWQILGNAYQSVVPLNVQGSYESAVSAYTKAEELNPLVPVLPYTRAQLEVARGDLKAARPFVMSAIELKQDYVPALLLLAQIELNSGNLKEAIARAEAASVFEPSNAVTHFQIGVLKFENKDYQGAEQSLNAALQLAPDYANAHYYLGRTHIAEGHLDLALADFGAVQKSNPDNADVAGIIEKLKAGQDPFAEAPKKK